MHAQNPKRPVVGVMSPFPVLGRAPSPQTGSSGAAAWYLFTELNKDYTLTELPTDLKEIPDGLDALLVVHPHDFDRRTLEAIDDYLVKGGRMAVFVDPMSAYALASAQKDYTYVNMTDSTLEPLLTKWGVAYSPSRLAADMNFKYDQLDRNGVRRTIPTALLINEAGIDRGNPVTGGLTSLRMNYAGFFDLRNPARTLTFEPLVYTTDYSMPADVADQPEKILADFAAPGKHSGDKLDLLMHITGQFPSAYDPEKTGGRPGEVYLFGDADMLFHDACVAQAKDEFGQTIVVRSNDNITLMENVVESLCGGGRLSSLRSRVPMSRPLTRINESQMRADLAFKDRILALAEESMRLEDRVESIRKQLIVSGGAARLTQDQRDLLNTYEQKDAALKREIREIRLQLRQDLDRINNTVRLINIVLIPAFVILCGIAWSIARKLKWKRHIS